MSIRRAAAVLCLTALLSPLAVGAEPLDADSGQALAKTLQTLRSLGPADLQGVDPRISAIARSPKLNEDFNELAAAIFTELAERYQGDPQKMQDALTNAQANPAAFAETFSPETRDQLQALAGKIAAAQ